MQNRYENFLKSMNFQIRAPSLHSDSASDPESDFDMNEWRKISKRIDLTDDEDEEEENEDFEPQTKKAKVSSSRSPISFVNKSRGQLEVCRICHKEMLKRNLTVHMRRSHEIKDCSVNVEQLGNSSRSEEVEKSFVDRNRVSEVPLNEAELFVCTFCDKSFNGIRSLNIHITVAHRKKPKQKSLGNKNCTICHRDLKSVEALDDHVKTVHSENRAKFECEICNFAYSTEGNLKAHYTKIHRKSLNNSVKVRTKHACSICSRTFGSSRELAAHEKLLTDNSKGVLCDVCGFLFVTSATLTRHYKANHPHVPAPLSTSFSAAALGTCSVCQRTFRNNKALKDHEKLHTNGSNVFACAVCSFSYAKSAELKKHYRNKHPQTQLPEFPASSTSTKFYCSICTRDFKSQTDFNKHEKQHNGKKKKKLFCLILFLIIFHSRRTFEA
jgi:hypothetical protein